MRLTEIKKKKIEIPYDPVEAAREQLERYKEEGIKLSPNGTLQLFIPRKFKRYDTRKEKYDYLIKDRAKYAFDDTGELLPHYKKWLEEGAPIIGGGSPVFDGKNKPSALLWTSTGRQKDNGTWDSSWNKYAQSARYEQAQIGYLYKVLPNTIVYELDGDSDAEIIYDIFYKLGRSNTAYNDKDEWERIRTSGLDQQYLLKKDFPWQEIQKHFDCIHHNNYRFGSLFGFNGETPFTYGWDCESSCWFKPDKLELLGQVNIYQHNDEEDDD